MSAKISADYAGNPFAPWTGVEVIPGIKSGANGAGLVSLLRDYILSGVGSLSVLPIANGGTGTASPGLVAGTSITITGSWPNQTINSAASAGTVTHTLGALTASAVVVGNGSADVNALGSLGTTVTVLHGNAAGLPTWGAVVLTTDVSGTLPTANGGTGNAQGTVGIPINAQSVSYTAVLTDANSCLSHPAADTTARTFTIPANASVAFPIGTALTFDNEFGAGAISIAIATDTLEMVGATGSTGTRTLATGGQATAIKKTSTKWRINGSLLT